MKRTWNPSLAALTIAFAACGGSATHGAATTNDGGSSSDGSSGDSGPSTGDSGPSTGDGSTPTGSNVVPVVVNAGPPGLPANDQTPNIPFISVTLCVPGTSNCQTLDYVSVDTGSSGMRVLASALPSSFTLPVATTTGGATVAECEQFADGFTYGSVRMADLKVGGELAANIPIQVIGDPAYKPVPSDCASAGTEEDSLGTFGSFGLIGINQIISDCGAACADPSNVVPGAYYACTNPKTCKAAALPVANQVSNPIASFTADNNGSLLTFPSVPAAGAPTLSGSLVFGIGTQANNALGNAKVLTVADTGINAGNFSTTFNSQSLQSFLDSGSTELFFNDSSIPQCAANTAGGGLFCPTSALSLSATNTGLNNVSTAISFSVGNATTLLTNSYFAYDNLAGPGSTGQFDWGFPFFVGRTVYVALEGTSTPGGKGPYFAY
jgi:hypothetical protein